MTRPQFRDHLADQALDVEVARRRTLFDGFRDLEEVTVEHASLDGNERIGSRWETLRAGEAAVIIPYDPKLDAIVVVRQFRIGAFLARERAAAIELPAGLVDEGETPEAAAIRELKEETSLMAEAMEKAYAFLSSPGLSNEFVTLFLAIVDASALPSRAGNEGLEDIRPILAPVDRLIEAVDEGRVENGFLVSAVHWFARKGRARAAALVASLDLGYKPD